MIPKVHQRGSRVGGLLRYLYGPGRREEHTNPHLVAAWDGAGDLTTLEPPLTAAGRRDLRRLTELLEIPVRAGRNPPARPVWHCSLRTHPSDPTLTDAQWRDIAGQVMAEVGIAPHGDDRAVRWLAVRHADDHIHVVATLVRQDRRTAWGRNDYRLAQAACRRIEHRYGLYIVGRPGQGTRVWPTAGEWNKTIRQGRPTPAREDLRRRLREAATVAVDEADFFHRLTQAGVQVRLRHSDRNPGQVTGYAVGLAEHTTATGQIVFYSGGKLAADLSLPRLRTRWGTDTNLTSARRDGARRTPIPVYVYARAAATLAQASAWLAAGGGDPDTVAGIIGAVADVLAATAAAWEGRRGGTLTTVAELFDRAAHHRDRPRPARPGGPGYELRATARMITLLGRRSGDQSTAQALQLLQAIAGFADALADLHQAKARLHQAQAARTAATALRTHTPPTGDAATANRPAPPRTTAPSVPPTVTPTRVPGPHR